MALISVMKHVTLRVKHCILKMVVSMTQLNACSEHDNALVDYITWVILSISLICLLL